ncbi:MAG: YqeG family HAD IIIA-type phosphatase [Coriobacteriaceae bacterium]|nr:YqeG family HAD IIIA-type phosphatase [Coriobacteriaceae bacterium]
MAIVTKIGFFQPDGFFSAVESIDPDELIAKGYRSVLLDIDNTLVPRDTKQIPKTVEQWIAKAKDSGLSICLLSNNWHKTVFSYADQLQLPCIYKAMKPLPFAFFAAIRRLGANKEQTVVIGDQLLTDVTGAHLTGMPAIMVKPRASKDLWHTLLLRRLERVLMGDRQPDR